RQRITFSRGNVLSSADVGGGGCTPLAAPTFKAADLSGGDRLLYMPDHIKKKLSEEIQALEHELNHELPKELKKAVAMGDLSENAEYHMAKQRQEFVRARLGQLKKRMADLSLVNMNNIPRDKVALGSQVTVYDNNKEEEMVYQL